MQVDPIKPTLKPPGTKRLKLKYDEPPSKFAFKFYLRRYNKAAHTQRFFQNHDDDIKCLTISQDRTLVATGQVGRTPVVCVWEPATCGEVIRLNFPAVRGICAVGFCRDAKILAAVGMDDNHTIFLWNWAQGKILAEVKGQTDLPPKVYGVVFDPYGADSTAGALPRPLLTSNLSLFCH